MEEKDLISVTLNDYEMAQNIEEKKLDQEKLKSLEFEHDFKCMKQELKDTRVEVELLNRTANEVITNAISKPHNRSSLLGRVVTSVE